MRKGYVDNSQFVTYLTDEEKKTLNKLIKAQEEYPELLGDDKVY